MNSDLNAARGMINGILVGIACWGIIGIIIYLAVTQ